MMKSCPCCRARLRGKTFCLRCHTDLGKVNAAEQSAQYWLTQALLSWEENDYLQSINALERSILLKNTQLAQALRDFYLHRQCQEIVRLLEQMQVTTAKQRLRIMKSYFPDSDLLQQLNSFTDYLLVKR